MRKLTREDGFTITEMMVATAVVMVVLSGVLTTFKNALAINDSASQLADANQNLRAGTNQLIRDLLTAGRLIGTDGIAMPTGTGITFGRPGPVASGNFDMVADGNSTLQLPAITTGYHLGPVINGSTTDMITIMTIDEFMPVVTTPVTVANSSSQATISADGSYIQFAAASLWIDGDTAGDTPAIKPGDLVYYQGVNGNAIQTVTSIDKTQHRILFTPGDPADFFRFNQSSATVQAANTGRPLALLKDPNLATLITTPWQVGICPAVAPAPATCPSTTPVTLFKALMITYYVDNTTTPGTPRLTRQINSCPVGWTVASGTPCAFAPQALAGVVEDLDLTYDLVDGIINPTAVPALPWTDTTQNPSVTYNSNQIRKVNVHVGVRSEQISKPTQDYVRNHINTSVDVRSLASVDRYQTAGEIQ
jgi:type II secretory pathway pseudopilin PulG